MTAAVSSAPRLPGRPPKDYFGRALVLGAILEVLVVAAIVWVSNQKSPPPPPKPKRIAIHMVQPPKPKPVPKPKPKPKPKPVPVPKPVPTPPPPPPRPIPKPAPKPLVAKAPAPTAPVIPAPPKPTPPPPPPAPSPAARQAAIDAYAALVRARVQADARVPEAVRLAHLRGTTAVRFELEPDGTLVWARIAQSSGIGSINRAALAAVQSASYPPFTKKMPKHPTIFIVRVHLSAHGG